MEKFGSSEVTDEIHTLACGPNFTIVSYTGCVVNGVKFLTTDRDGRVTTQNSGIRVQGTENDTNYRELKEILELICIHNCSVVFSNITGLILILGEEFSMTNKLPVYLQILTGAKMIHSSLHLKHNKYATWTIC